MLLEEINYAPGEDKMKDVFDKANTLIETFNAILAGGTSGQSIRKVDGTDFNFEFFTQPAPPNYSDRQTTSANNVTINSSYTTIAVLTAASGVNRDYIITGNFTIKNNSGSSVNGCDIILVSSVSGVIAQLSKDIQSGSFDTGSDTVTISTLFNNVDPGTIFSLKVRNTPSIGGGGVTLSGCVFYIDGQRF